MKTFKIILLTMAALSLLISGALAAGDVERGKALFHNPRAFGAPGEKACSSCHPNGKGLERAAEIGKKDWTNPGGKWLSLEDANSVCIELGNKGQYVDHRSDQMQDLVAYIKSLSKANQ